MHFTKRARKHKSLIEAEMELLSATSKTSEGEPSAETATTTHVDILNILAKVVFPPFVFVCQNLVRWAGLL